MRQLRFAAVDSRTLGDMKVQSSGRLLTHCDKCGNTSNLPLDCLITKYKAETRVLYVLAILQARCNSLSGKCAMMIRE
jgi:hypothetical protein